MRVCMLIWKYWPWIQGGTERQCRSMSHALTRMGVDVTVVTHWPGGGIPRREMDSAVRIVRLGTLAPVARVVQWARRPAAWLLRRRAWTHLTALEIPKSKTPPLLVPLVCLDIEKLLFVSSAHRFFRRNRGEFDLLHVHESHWLAGLGVDLGAAFGIPVLVKEASYPVLGSLDATSPCRRRFDLLRRRAHYLVPTPEGAAQLVAQGVAGDDVLTLPNGVDVPAAAADPASNTLVLCVANLIQGNYWKSFSTLLAAWQEVQNQRPSGVLALVGAGDAGPWKEYARELGIGNSVLFPGESGDIGSWYRQAAIFVLPSRCEGMSNALLEAQSWGLPAVVSDIPGNRAVIRDGINGIVFPVGDAHRLATAIISLLDSPAQRQTMGQAGRRRIEEDFAMPAVASRLAEVYRNLAGGASSLSPHP